MQKNKFQLKDILISGFAIFSMFFGAGNLIFPPALGVMSGEEWFKAYLGFFIMDVVLALMGIFVIIIYDGDLLKFTERLGKRASFLILFLALMCTGPLISIPRTCAVTYSMAVVPVLNLSGDHPFILAVVSLVFFAITFAFSIKPGKVIDIVGKYLTPVLLISLLLIIVVGIFTSPVSPEAALIDNTIETGIVNGYQTMDGLGAIIFSTILVKTMIKGSNGTIESAYQSVFFSGMLASFLLFVVYCGLCYLGTSWGIPYSDQFMHGYIDQAGLFTFIVKDILGQKGLYLVAITSMFACLTTAIGLTTACADCLCNLFDHKIPYRAIISFICIIGILLANIGLKNILKFAEPILTLLYPVIITLILLGLFSKKIKGRMPFILGTIISFVISLINMLYDNFKIGIFSFTDYLPLDEWRLDFLLPTVIAVAIGLAIDEYIYRADS